MSDLGAMLKAARCAAGLSLTAMANRISFSKSYLSNIENGIKPVTEAVAEKYAIVLGDPDMNRRSVLGAGATLLSEVVRQRLVSAAGDPSSLDDWHDVADEYGRAYMTASPRDLGVQLSSDMLCLSSWLEKRQSTAMQSVAARLSVIQGMTMASLGNPIGAVRWYRTARHNADASGDRKAMVWARGRAAFTMGYEGSEPGSVIALADQAAEIDDRPSLGLLEAHLARAHAFSRLAMTRESLAALAAAEHVFTQVESSDVGTVYTMPRWRWHMNASLALSRLGISRDARREQDHAEELIPPGMTRFRTHVELHRAILAKDADHANKAIEALPDRQRSLSIRLLAREAANGERRQTGNPSGR